MQIPKIWEIRNKHWRNHLYDAAFGCKRFPFISETLMKTSFIMFEYGYKNISNLLNFIARDAGTFCAFPKYNNFLISSILTLKDGLMDEAVVIKDLKFYIEKFELKDNYKNKDEYDKLVAAFLEHPGCEYPLDDKMMKYTQHINEVLLERSQIEQEYIVRQYHVTKMFENSTEETDIWNYWYKQNVNFFNCIQGHITSNCEGIIDGIRKLLIESITVFKLMKSNYFASIASLLVKADYPFILPGISNHSRLLFFYHFNVIGLFTKAHADLAFINKFMTNVRRIYLDSNILKLDAESKVLYKAIQQTVPLETSMQKIEMGSLLENLSIPTIDRINHIYHEKLYNLQQVKSIKHIKRESDASISKKEKEVEEIDTRIELMKLELALKEAELQKKTIELDLLKSDSEKHKFNFTESES